MQTKWWKEFKKISLEEMVNNNEVCKNVHEEITLKGKHRREEMPMAETLIRRYYHDIRERIHTEMLEESQEQGS